MLHVDGAIPHNMAILSASVAYGTTVVEVYRLVPLDGDFLKFKCWAGPLPRLNPLPLSLLRPRPPLHELPEVKYQSSWCFHT